MVDNLTTDERSALMSRIRGVNTEPERVVRSYLHALGYRFRLYVRKLPGKPDVVLRKHRIVIFVHGCFWHGHKGCRKGRLPRSNVAFWADKIKYNTQRSTDVVKQLEDLGWKVVIVWACETTDLNHLQRALAPLIRLPSD
jgi:DNA mismatch endonuclease (patch repair protein)